MSQIEQTFRQLLSRKPEIEKCYAEGLVNRRALARYLIKHTSANKNQINAVIAMLRRFDFREPEKTAKETIDLLKQVRMHLKDKILILDFEKDKALLQSLQKVVAHINYDRGDTLKIVVGTMSITLYLDEKKYHEIKEVVDRFTLQHKWKNISEISLIFPEEAIKTKGIFATITRELVLHDINIIEMLTASSELLIYLKEGQVIKAYEIIKRFQE